jgi:stage IV sporulation protein FB
MWSTLSEWPKFRFHPLFILVMLLSVVTGYFLEALTLFGIVFVHELGHVAAAKGFGWRIRQVQLLPFGGVAEVEEQGTVPAREELIVALAGPFQHVWLIGLSWLMKLAGVFQAEWWDYFVNANLMIGLFNLLPILPLDGGKVLQSLISYNLSYRRTIEICTYISLMMSVFIVGTALFRAFKGDIQLNLLVIGLFLLYSNWYHYRNLPYHFVRFLMNREAVVGRLISRGTLAQPIVVQQHRKVADIVKLFMRDKYHLIYVIGEKGTIRAVLPEQRLVNSYFAETPPGSPVSELFVVK